jgi:hypothetical protein
MDAGHSNRGLDFTEKPPAHFLQDDAPEDKHLFWSVDPVEWSPITNVQVHSVPLTANDYLQNKPLVQEAPPTRPEAPPASRTQPQQKQDEKVEHDRSTRLNEVLNKLLPIIVVILLLLGLLGALLSSFFYPSNRHGSYILPSHASRHIVVEVQYKEGNNG